MNRIERCIYEALVKEEKEKQRAKLSNLLFLFGFGWERTPTICNRRFQENIWMVMKT